MSKVFNRFMPAFIPLLFEVMRHLRRDSNHNSNIKKNDRTTEKLGTIEHLMVRLEKKVQLNRDVYNKSFNQLRWWLIINSALLIAILVKLFFY